MKTSGAKRKIIQILSASGLVLLIALIASPARGVPPSFNKIPDTEARSFLLRQDTESETLIGHAQLIYVSADWCLECPKFEKSVLHNSRLTSHLNSFNLYHLDATVSPGIWPELTQIGIQSLPALIVRTENGTRALSAHSDFPIEALISLLATR